VGDKTLGYSISIDADGNVLNAEVNSYKGFTDRNILVEQTLRMREYFVSANTETHWNPMASRSTLQQYAFDSQRLLQFNTGADAKTLTNVKVTFGAHV
jgi:hypothetical protein